MKRLVLGIFAHVDSGKTTLSEGLLYTSGEITSLGRVDHKNSHLDTDSIEKDRGITIFSHQARIEQNGSVYTLVDTPGHVDFSAETERVMHILDYAILVISATDGVQSHTETLWRLLSHYGVPVFIFVNKTDLPGFERKKITDELVRRFGEGCIPFDGTGEEFYESAAMCDEYLLKEYLDTGKIKDPSLSSSIAARRIFPVYFGSALKLSGVMELLSGIDKYTEEKKYPSSFGARIYKIGEDEKARRLTYMKITGGELNVKDILPYKDNAEKVNEIRIYSGAKFKSVSKVYPGEICACIGLSDIPSGAGAGFEASLGGLLSEPVFSYNMILPEGTDIHKALLDLKRLEAEETGLDIEWNEKTHRIGVRIMGEVQLEVLRRILSERFSLDAEFEEGNIIYKETVRGAVEGVGHYEPLRHYAEVHLLIEPAKRGEGIIIASKCSEDILEKNWQRLILSHIAEKEHRGVLCGAALTDVKITLVNGRAHKKHTEGGDFRQATYRAIRQGLMRADNVLLEPWYDFSIELPTASVGRAMTDLERMGAKYRTSVINEDTTRITGRSSVRAISGYQAELIAYTRGRGRISFGFSGYDECKDSDEIIKKFAYNPEADLENSPDSIFCAHGGGFLVKWNEVEKYMHLGAYFSQKAADLSPPSEKYKSAIAKEEDLLKIFEMTYGKIKTRVADTVIRTQKEPPKFHAKPAYTGPYYLLIDGYNIIYAVDELKRIAQESLNDARLYLISRLANYHAMKKYEVILVFDAYKVKGGVGAIEEHHGVKVVYTKEAETADSYIEKTSEKLLKHYRVRVATSDGAEQMIIFGNGAERMSAREFYAELLETEAEMRRFISDNNGDTGN